MPIPRLRRPQLSYANVTATLALVVATSTGGAYAAATIGSAQIKDDAVKSRHIASNSVKTPELKDGAVTEGKLADGSVTGDKLGDGSVTEGKLGDGSVITGKLGDGSVTTGKLGDGSVTEGKLGDGSVTTGKLGDGSVTAGKLGSDVGVSRAFATVWYTGSFGPSRGLGGATVTRPETGVYCIANLPFTPTIALANSTLEPNAFHHDVEIYGIMGNFAASAPCPGGTQLQVRVYAPGTTSEQNGNFNIAIF